MNYFITPSALFPTRQLIRQKEEQLSRNIVNLRIIDVLDSDHFSWLKQELKRIVLIKPVVFGKPALSTHHPVVKRGQLLGRLRGKLQSIYTHVVQFPFTGSSELFCCMPDPQIICGDETGIFKPSGNCVLVDIGLPFQPAEEVISEASVMVALTRQIISQNNDIVAAWTHSIEQRIEGEMDAKRHELLQLYGYPMSPHDRRL